jgi:hypothetical protein
MVRDSLVVMIEVVAIVIIAATFVRYFVALLEFANWSINLFGDGDSCHYLILFHHFITGLRVSKNDRTHTCYLSQYGLIIADGFGETIWSASNKTRMAQPVSL